MITFIILAYVCFFFSRFVCLFLYFNFKENTFILGRGTDKNRAGPLILTGTKVIKRF